MSKKNSSLSPSLKELIKKFSKNDVIEEMEKEYQAVAAKKIPLALIDDNSFVRRVEIAPEDHARHEGDDRRGERQPTRGGRVALADEQQEQAGRDRQPDEHAQDGPVSLHGVSSPRVATRAVPRGR